MSKQDNTIHLVAIERCKACGLCIAACPKQTLGMGTALNYRGYTYVTQVAPENCVRCNICRVVCPDVAIGVIEAEL